MTDKTRAWLQIRKAVPAINNVGQNPVEVRTLALLLDEYKIQLLQNYKTVG